MGLGLMSLIQKILSRYGVNYSPIRNITDERVLEIISKTLPGQAKNMRPNTENVTMLRKLVDRRGTPRKGMKFGRKPHLKKYIESMILTGAGDPKTKGIIERITGVKPTKEQRVVDLGEAQGFLDKFKSKVSEYDKPGATSLRDISLSKLSEKEPGNLEMLRKFIQTKFQRDPMYRTIEDAKKTIEFKEYPPWLKEQTKFKDLF